MADQITRVTHKGLGSKLVSSVKGIFFGILLFILSFGVLFWNEGTVNLAEVAKTSVEVSATETASAELNGKFVSTTGTVTSEETLGDNLYLKPGEYLSLRRRVEMFSWSEKTETKTEKKLGGGEEEVTTYTYTKEWVNSPSDSSGFEESVGHSNPSKTQDDYSTKVSSAKIGNFELDMGSLDLPGGKSLTLTDSMLDLSSVKGANLTDPGTVESSGFTVSGGSTDVEVTTGEAETTAGATLGGNYIYLGQGSISSPEVGDLRISYSALDQDIVATVFAKQNGQKLAPHYDEKSEDTIYRMTRGSRDQGIAQYQQEYTMMLWVFRVLGFLMMWIGLSMLFGPLTTVMDVVPILGDLSSVVIKAVTFAIALVMSVITILISMILHSLLALIVIAVVTIGALAFYLKTKGKKLKKKH